MEEKHPFLQLLKPIRKGLRFELFIREGQLFLVLLGAWLMGLLLLSRVIVIPFMLRGVLVGTAVLSVILFLRLWLKRPGYHDAAVLFNQFIEDDRVITAYSFIQDDGIIEKLQLRDAVQHMKEKQADVLKRKKHLLQKQMLAGSFVLFAGAALLIFIPNENNELAKKKETDLKLVDKAEKELEEKIKKEKDEGVKKNLKDITKKIAQSQTAEEALKELAKQTKQLELKELKEKEKQEAMQNWQNSLNKSGLNRLADLLDQKDLEKIEKELAKLNKQWEQLTDQQKAALQSFTKQEEQLSDEELAAVVKEIKDALQSSDTLEKLADAKEVLQSSGQDLQQQLIANGTPPSKLAFSSGNGGNSSGQASTSNNSSQNNTGNSTSSQGNSSTGTNNSSGGSSSGNGAGSGSGSGAGSGSGGSGTGNGTGSGLGGGAGLGQGSRDFLTIPEKVAGDEHQEVDGGQLGEGNAVGQSEGSGPVLKGTIRPYEEVYGEYEQSYRESSERYQLPSNLEKMVQNYFTNIDPNGE